jgi:di/tricarboxylate transporter
MRFETNTPNCLNKSLIFKQYIYHLAFHHILFDYTKFKEALCGYTILIMAIFWMTEALPLPITSLIPVVAFPLFGILDTGAVCMAYMKVLIKIFRISFF